MVAWGDVEDLRVRVGQLFAAGADHVAVIPIGHDVSTDQLQELEALARD
jgi:hypothetical protein